MRSPLEAALLACCRYSEHTVRFVVSSLEGQKGFRLPGEELRNPEQIQTRLLN